MKSFIPFFMCLAVSFVLLTGCAPSGEAQPAAEDPTTTGLVIESEGEHTISLPLCDQQVSVHHSYEAYLPYVTDELIHAADLALSQILADHPDDNSGVYLTFDEDGYLCLCAEVIVYFESEEEGMSGCGFDHDHVFYRERISTEPVK